MPPRGGHTAVSLGKNIFIFGGFTDDQSLFDDVYMLDVGMLSGILVMPYYFLWSECFLFFLFLALLQSTFIIAYAEASQNEFVFVVLHVHFFPY